VIDHDFFSRDQDHDITIEIASQPGRSNMVDLRKSAIATAAATVLLLPTTAKANVVDFLLVQPSSNLTANVTLTGPVLGGTKASVPQAAGADTTTYFGHLYVDFQPGTIQLMPGSSISAAINGVWAPHDPVSSNPSGPPPAGADPGNYGLAFPTIQLVANQYGLVLDNGAPGIPSTPMAIDGGGNFALAGQAMHYTAGRQAFVSALGNSTASTIDFPTIFSTSSADIGNWNVGTQTLTIPIHSKVTFNVTQDFDGIDESNFLTGQLVAVPFVPEPSSFVLAALGLIGLVVWRRRKR
jgi:hypothetical protein